MMLAISHITYILASTRRDQYYIDVALDFTVLERQIRSFEAIRRGPNNDWDVYDPPLLVWNEAHGDAAAAQARVAQIRAWPHRWQRRLIESQNPYWLDRLMLLQEWPVEWWYVIPETTPKGYLCHGPDGIPADEVLRLKALYRCGELPEEFVEMQARRNINCLRRG